MKQPPSPKEVWAKREGRELIAFQSEFNHISPMDLENIMESLGDAGYLSSKGKNFRSRFWKLFIKEAA